MGLLSKLKQDTNSLEIAQEKDTLGGMTVFDSDAYPAVIKLAYHTVSPNTGANAVSFKFQLEDGREYSTTEYITSGTAKGGKHYYTTSKGENRFLPGFTVADNIAQLTVGESILDLDAEEKVVKIYDYDAKAEVPKSVPMFMDIIGKKVTLGLIKKRENKNVKSNTGAYVPTAETREVNEIQKVFSEDGLTTSEVKAGVTEPTFLKRWADKYKGQVIDRSDPNIAPAANTNSVMKAAMSNAKDIFED
jgi:hypothetical protein